MSPPTPGRPLKTQVEMPSGVNQLLGRSSDADVTPTMYAPIQSGSVNLPNHAQASAPPRQVVAPVKLTPLFAPQRRPPVAKLVVMDDASATEGEVIRIRKDEFSIGRTTGDLLLEHDRDMSSKHALLRRVSADNRLRWQLHDLGSTNGTFVRLAKAALTNNKEILIGATRFEIVIETGSREQASSTQSEAATRMYSVAGDQTQATPTIKLVNPIDANDFYEISSRGATIGSDAMANDIVLEQSFVCPKHASITHSNGKWIIEDLGSVNGTWLKVKTVWLDGSAEFQLGEQRFRFFPDGIVHREG